MHPPREEHPAGEALARYAACAAPWGVAWLAATERGLCRVAFGLSEDAWRRLLAAETGLLPLHDPAALRRAVEQLAEYFAGRRQVFDVPLAPAWGTPFQRRVWQETARIPYGETRSYGALARSLGDEGAARAVGQALGRNPLPIFIPCHRVVAAAGQLGGYTGGLEIKRALLALEGALPRRG